jgi:hypothetical protein
LQICPFVVARCSLNGPVQGFIMAISVECESCGAGFKVADTYAGKRGKCPKCGEVFTVRPVDAAPSSAASPAKRQQAAGSSVAKNFSPQSPGAKQPGTSKRTSDSGSSSNVRPAIKAKRGAGPPPAPVRAVPVGSVPEAIPVGGLPGGSSVGKAIVRPAMGPGVSVGKSTHGHAKKYKRKKGTPMIIWVIIAVGGLTSAGGWIYVATREDEKPVAQAPVAKNPAVAEKQLTEKQSSDKKLAETAKGAKGAGKSEPADEAEDKANKTADARKLSVVPEAAAEKEEMDPDAALAGGGDLGSKIRKRPPTTTRAGGASTPAAPKAKEPEAEAAAVEGTPVTAEEINALAETCKQNAWKAETKEQYADLAALASAMMNPADDAAYTAASNLIQGPIRDVVWTTDGAKQINRQAAKELDKVGTGCFVVAQVTEQVDGGALLKLTSTEAMVKINMEGGLLAQARPGIIYLLIGLVQPESYDLPPGPKGDARRARVIDCTYRMIINELYDREESTIGPAKGGGE